MRKLKMSLGLNLDSISFQSHFLSLSLCFAAQETYIWKATPPFPRQHPLHTNRTYEDSCGFTHTFTASHTHTHTHFWNMWYIHSSNEFVLQFCSEDKSVELDFLKKMWVCLPVQNLHPLRCCYLVATICRVFFTIAMLYDILVSRYSLGPSFYISQQDSFCIFYHGSGKIASKLAWNENSLYPLSKCMRMLYFFMTL